MYVTLGFSFLMLGGLGYGATRLWARLAIVATAVAGVVFILTRPTRRLVGET